MTLSLLLAISKEENLLLFFIPFFNHNFSSFFNLTMIS